MANPLLPRSQTNPVGQTKRIRTARKATNRRLRTIERDLLRQWDALPVQVQNGRLLTNQFYEYLIDLDILRAIVTGLNTAFTSVGQDTVADQVRAAYRQGTAQASDNLSRITDDYTRTVTEVLRSRPVQRRAALAASRLFELMEGFGGDAAADLSRILYQAVSDGVNPRIVAQTIRKRFGVHRRRAERIARTEITTALRRGNWDEDKDAQQKFGFTTKLMHFSALLPTTRQTHAARHGRTFTNEETREWYAEGGNAISCRCTQRSVLVDDDGELVIGKALSERLAVQRKQFTGMG